MFGSCDLGGVYIAFIFVGLSVLIKISQYHDDDEKFSDFSFFFIKNLHKFSRNKRMHAPGKTKKKEKKYFLNIRL